LKEEALEGVIKGIRSRAKGMQRTAAFFFGGSVGVLLGAIVVFLKLGDINENYSVVLVVLSLFSRLFLTVFTFYVVRIMMSIVTYNIGLSNDLYAKADSLELYSPNGTISLNELKEHLEVNNHKFEASKGFSGKDEHENILKIMKNFQLKPEKSSEAGTDKSASGF